MIMRGVVADAKGVERGADAVVMELHGAVVVAGDRNARRVYDAAVRVRRGAEDGAAKGAARRRRRMRVGLLRVDAAGHGAGALLVVLLLHGSERTPRADDATSATRRRKRKRTRVWLRTRLGGAPSPFAVSVGVSVGDGQSRVLALAPCSRLVAPRPAQNPPLSERTWPRRPHVPSVRPTWAPPPQGLQFAPMPAPIQLVGWKLRPRRRPSPLPPALDDDDADVLPVTSSLAWPYHRMRSRTFIHF